MKVIIWLGLLVVAPLLSADTKEGLYFQSMQLLQEKKYDAASRAFLRLRILLEQEQARKKKGTKPWHMLALGQCDAMLYRAEVAWIQKRKQDACLERQKIAKKMKELPAKWQRWNTNRLLKKRLLATDSFLKNQCALVPSYFKLQRTPPHTQVSLQLPSGTWKKLKGIRHATTQERLRLKAEATGFLPRVLTLSLARWRDNTFAIKLKPEPPRIIVVLVRRREPPKPQKPKAPKAPPLPLPLTQKWWFWTIVGVGVVGIGVTAVAIGVTVAEKNHVWEGNEGPFFKVW